MFFSAILSILSALTSVSQARSADLYFADVDGIVSFQDKIEFTSISYRKGGAEVGVHTPSMRCRIRTASAREANRLQEQLASDSDAVIQCFGKMKNSEQTNFAEVETSSFSLGRRSSKDTFDVKRAEAKQVVTGI